jgi:hypothetical protein
VRFDLPSHCICVIASFSSLDICTIKRIEIKPIVLLYTTSGNLCEVFEIVLYGFSFTLRPSCSTIVQHPFTLSRH